MSDCWGVNQGPKLKQAGGKSSEMSRYRGTREYDLVRERMIEAARSPERVVRYRPDIARLIGIGDDESGDHVVKQLADICGEISEDEHAAGRPLLSAVVVNEEGHPGSGFFRLARRLRIPFEDNDTFWIHELQRVANYWTTH